MSNWLSDLSSENQQDFEKLNSQGYSIQILVQMNRVSSMALSLHLFGVWQLVLTKLVMQFRHRLMPL